MHRFIRFAFAMTLLASAGASTRAQKRYHVAPLHSAINPVYIGGASSNALSGNGYLVGTLYYSEPPAPSSQYLHPILWKNQTETLLGYFRPPSSQQGFASTTGVNRLAQVVGNAEQYDARNNDKGVTAFLWTNGTLTRLPDLGHDPTGKVDTFAAAINDSGDVVGGSHTFDVRANDTGPVAFLYHNGTASPLVDFGSSSAGNHSSSATGINNAGQISGNALAYDSNHNDLGAIVFLYDNGTVTTLPSPGADGAGRSRNYSVAINDSGLIVGDAVVYNPATFHEITIAVVWKTGTVTRLPDLDAKPNGDTYSVPTAVNSSGDIVGNSFKKDSAALTYPYNFSTAGVLWHDGVLYDLSTLLVTSMPTYLAYASGISDGGRIYTEGIANTLYFTALLIPVAGGDFDNDGFADLLWQNTTTGDVTIGFSDGNTYRGTASLASAVPADWQIVATPDLNGDGHSDILWRNSTNGDIAYWLTNGQTLIDSRLLASAVPLDWRVVGSGDFVGDGYTDILFQNQTTGDVAYWQMQGTTFVRSRTLATAIPLDWQIVGVADLNHDGSDDVLLRNGQNGDLAYWFLHGDTIVDAGLITPTISLDWQVKGVGDLTGDGTVGLLWQNVTTGDVYAWTLDGTALANTRFIASAIPTQWHLVGPK